MICDRPSDIDIALQLRAILVSHPQGRSLVDLILQSQLPQDQVQAGLDFLLLNGWAFHDCDRYWVDSP